MIKLAKELWMLLDDIDTIDDIAKDDPKIYRQLVRATVIRRFHPKFHPVIDEIESHPEDMDRDLGVEIDIWRTH